MNNIYFKKILFWHFQITKLQAAIKYGEEDLPGAKVSSIIHVIGILNLCGFPPKFPAVIWKIPYVLNNNLQNRWEKEPNTCKHGVYILCFSSTITNMSTIFGNWNESYVYMLVLPVSSDLDIIFIRSF